MDLDWLTVLDNISQMVWMMRPDGDITWVNKQYIRYFGDTYERLVVENKAWECIHPDDLDITLQAVKEWCSSNQGKELIYRIKRYDGEYLWHLVRCTMIRHDDESKNVKYLIGTVTNIHEQRVAEEKAKRIEEQLTTVIQHAPVIIWAVDKKGIYTMFNGRAIESTGYYAEWFIGKSIFDITLEQPELAGCVQRAMAGESCSQKEQEWGGRYFELFYSPSRDNKGAINGVVAIAVDITTRKEAAELAIKEKSARETAKLRSEFLANVSHELRTPLNAILGLSELLLHIVSPPLIDEQYNNVETIHSSALALLSIINQILDFSRIDAGRIDLEYIPFNIQSLVKDQMKIINPIVIMHKQLNNLDIQVDIDSNLPEHVEGDPTRIGQVLLNLLSNSIKFTERGNVKVKITKVGTGIGQATSVKEDSHNLNTILIRFAVIDTGIGISKEALQTLFQPFSQATSSTKKRFGGTGLGLSICQKLVEAMNGRIGVDSEKNKGSTFWFELPLKECPLGQYSEYNSSGNRSKGLSEPNNARFLFEPSSIQGNILVAEDHPVNQMLLVALLRKLAHKVTAVDNGEEALREFIKANCTAGAPQYDLILMDCQMPEMDGYQATRAIREEERIFFASSKLPDNDNEKDYTHRIPIIALTANAIETNQSMCIEAGMDDFVTKPITLRQVSAMVTKWLLLKTKEDIRKK